MKAKTYPFFFTLESLPPRNIKAQSSPKRRVVESALALLAGFAPPLTAQEIWSNKSDLGRRWQPVAVQTASPGRAWLLGEGGCPEVDRLIPLAHNLPLTVQTWDAAVEFRARLTSAMNVTFPLWSDLATLYDTVICEQEYFGRLGQWTEPAWIQGAGPGTMEQLAVFRRLQFIIYGLLPMEYKRLQAGPFLKEVIAKMKSPPEEEGFEGGPQKKVFLYGTHDTVMVPILHVLGVFQGQPSYGSGLILELLASSKSSKSQNRTTTVRMSFFNVTADDVRFSALPFNGSKTFSGRCSAGDCDLGSVEESLRQYLPVDIELECGLKSGNEDSRNSSRTTVLLLVVALVLAIAGNVGLLSAQCCVSPKRSGYQTM